MKINRRNFIKSIGASGLILASTRLETLAQNSASRLKIIVFWEENFPFVDGIRVTKNFIANALKNHDTIFAGADELKTKLAEKDIDVFINPYGSAFPKTAWTAILKYLQAGGNFFNFGGRAFAVPVKKTDGVWKAETEQVNYHKRLGILQYAKVQIGGYSHFKTTIAGLKNQSPELIGYTFEPYPKLTNSVEFPEESGSDGLREANLTALISQFNNLGEKDSVPALQFDRLRGEFAGGRWIFFGGNMYDAQIDKFDSRTFSTLAEIAAFGAFEFKVTSKFACYHPGDNFSLIFSAFSPLANKNGLEIKGDDVLTISLPNGTNLNTVSEVDGWVKFKNHENEFEIGKIEVITSGYFLQRVGVKIRSKSGVIQEISAHPSFWVYDEKLMAKGAKFSADKHFLYRNGEPFPVVGTTYMASDVHRRFLLEPNPEIWDKDFAEMKRAGVNIIRTGIWTGWKLMADEKGAVREEVLRAFEAFILTAKKYDIPVTFTFFAFMPEMFGGENAYLDPQAIAGQKKFISAFAARVKTAKDVGWDLINEPSFANPKQLWSCRPNYDEFENRAWREWLMRRHSAKDENDLRDILSEKWRLREDEDALALPKKEDFENVNIISNRRILKAQEFRLFAQYVFKSWAQTMRETLRAAGNESQMVTVGQDEAGTGDSPSTQFHADAVDFTCLHNWWSNDDLLWDNVVSKSPTKPNLIEESGVMSYEKLDGSMWRGESQTAQLMKRKMMLALGANGCGFIEWIWNTNPYMNVDNEAGIGFLRADGSQKPELAYFKRLAAFVNSNRKYFRGKRDEKTLLVIPHTYQFTPRSLATEATKKSVRAMYYYCRHTMRSVSEYNLDAILAEKEKPSLIIVPSPQMLTQTAIKNLLQLVSGGATLAITGYFYDDENLIHQEYPEFEKESEPVAVASYEKFRIGETRYDVRFAGEKMQRIFKSSFFYETPITRDYGDGTIIWCSLPLELGETIEPIAAFYNYALKQAKLSAYFSLENETPSALVIPTEFEESILYTVVNERGDSSYVSLTHLPTKTNIQFKLNEGDAAMAFVDKRTGEILART